MTARVWLWLTWADAERLARGDLPARVQRRLARLLQGAVLPPVVRTTNSHGPRVRRSQEAYRGTD